MKRYLALFLISAVFSGCAEGPLHRFGHMNPWVVERWEKEDQYAMTLYTKRTNIRELAKQTQSQNLSAATEAVAALSQILGEEDLALAKVEAARALGMAKSPVALSALHTALEDPEPEVRIAVCESLGLQANTDSIGRLEGVVNGDTENNVRLAAARALGNIPDPSAARALTLALGDRSPALQFRAMESLKQITGENFEGDAERWRTYVKGEIQIDRDPPSFAEQLSRMLR